VKYVPKIPFRVRLPTGEEKTVFTRGSLTPDEVLRSFGLESCKLKYRGKELDEKKPIAAQGVEHDGLLIVEQSREQSKRERRPWFERVFANRGN